MIPSSTYRIQFRNGMTFDRVVDLIPYMKDLGISHLYASPVFTATTDSTHGYDVTDPNEIDPAIGGREGFDRMAAALKQAGMGLILDIVPNHMSTSLENRWWRDVIEHGKKSRYAAYFDIDGSRPLTLPFLGDTFEAELERGAITLKRDSVTNSAALVYYDTAYPLNPGTYDESKSIAEIHAAQSWRLMSWREAPKQLSWRRFFEITGLVGVRVEDEAVFADTHRLILELVHAGTVDGLRIDHVDGLADPLGYLQRLRAATGPDCYITVEKILAKGEQLPPEWPVSGTTGYEFIASLAEVLVDDTNLSRLETLHDETLGTIVDRQAELRKAKGLMTDRNFEGEFTTLLKIASELAGHNGADVEHEDIRHALRELLIAFPVYRTYGTAEGLTPSDVALLSRVVASVNTSEPALSLIVRILTGDVPEHDQALASLFRTRFQQLTGPLMAKSVEDTLFFRHNLELALNEVGADPTPRAFSLSRFHQEMRIRLARQPDALLGTSTHDTKRGEDARARLYTLTEAPDLWSENLARWRQMNQTHVRFLNDGTAPNAADTWMIFQALAGVWPATLSPDDRDGLKSLEARFLGFIEKALREAKQRTDWIDSNEGYESVVLDYVRHLLSPDNTLFLHDFSAALQPFIRAGLMNSMSQTVIKLTAPGVPDIYQGSEGLNFSLVDPDNRREPDFTALAENLSTADATLFNDAQRWRDGSVKQYVTATLLRLRPHYPALFRYGDWLPLKVSGEREEKLIVYARINNDEALIVAVPRLVFDVTDNATLWANTTVAIPQELAGKRYRDLFTGERRRLPETLDLTSEKGCLLVLLTCD
ncbi:malto-oligosyltrehalose synthase [Enterobacter hormaechei]|uniref:Malto-oligosyltrehalose synthase n=1 Tax=Enterobacter hormaechei TaxID=158836 RepID=A0AAX3Z8X7_9ENTR|nr:MULTISPECIES: malto-oligosyltrehalose synthase [Enterobacter cloacae complex]UAS96647.1 malto-oligosyltrehalose synthase [Enterobacter cloacae complex sp.]AJB71081.1 malto-oligosyltrehalose synthase [Enterobacter hormaechei subsp. hormaechei]EGK60301.1 (1->4)-alpha-D-glucan 1-alpha-D-glucosylmutase [Enterobacter hormaechei ATCC 49162]EGQ5312432.1 malto-oligosyltrehalose synthase [Enterobacter hormaechei]EGQ5317285.1 malto-oligosyltrehalose synthase [Enterobacter hormaechei]